MARGKKYSDNKSDNNTNKSVITIVITTIKMMAMITTVKHK